MIGEDELLYIGVPREELEECLRLAFGDDYENLYVRHILKIWNERHRDIFVMQGDDNASEAFERIGMAYLGHKKGRQ